MSYGVITGHFLGTWTVQGNPLWKDKKSDRHGIVVRNYVSILLILRLIIISKISLIVNVVYF